MSWHFSQALEEEFLAENSSAGKRSALLKTTALQGMFWSPDKTTDASPPSRSGMTYGLSTDGHGEAVLTWFLEASLAKTSAPPEKERDSMELEAGCGLKCDGSSKRPSLDMSSLKIHRCSRPPGGLKDGCSKWWIHSSGPYGTAEKLLYASSQTSFVFWKSFPRWGMMRSGVLSERTKPEPRTREIESGSSQSFPTPYGLSANQGQGDGEFGKAIRNWPTPAARDGKGTNSREHCETNGTGAKHMDQLANAVAYPELRFPTPMAQRSGSNKSPCENGSTRLSLDTMASQNKWPTPTASMLTTGDMEQARTAGNSKLRKRYAESKKMWPTPTASNGGSNNNSKAVTERGHGTNLVGAVKMFPTPCSSEDKYRLQGASQQSRSLGAMAATQGIEEETGGQLNPTWVEWLMGWPLGWTDCDASAMDRFQQWCQSHDMPFD